MPPVDHQRQIEHIFSLASSMTHDRPRSGEESYGQLGSYAHKVLNYVLSSWPV
jgi:hypothetical protein